jgi:hypothetical protein
MRGGQSNEKANLNLAINAWIIPPIIDNKSKFDVITTWKTLEV